MTLQEAQAAVNNIWPGEGVTLQVKGQVHKVVAKDGTVLGASFSWRPALQQAAKPKLDAAARAHADAVEQQRADFALFLEFLREHLADKFIAWKQDRAAKPVDQKTEAGRAEPDQGKLVQIIRP
jgi:hypothetical protein